MPLFLAGINQKTAPVAVRERFAFGGGRATARPGRATPGARPRRHPLDLQSHGAVRRRAAASATSRKAALDFLTDAKGLTDGVFDERFHFYGEARPSTTSSASPRASNRRCWARRRYWGRCAPPSSPRRTPARRTPTWRGSSTPRYASGRRARSETASAATACR